ncbi:MULTISPECIES: hypothetical protein [Bacillus]|uniref:hypothetical protein n=1 Tax=Bacillus TaxID=1386 RepID=UPI0030FBE619
MGTRMKLHRYSPITKDWDEILHVVDQDFVKTYGTSNPILPVGHTYEPNKGLLKVYYNGRRLLSGVNYIELDDYHIHLGVGSKNEERFMQLQIGDEVYIEIYKNQYCSRGQATISGTQFYDLQKEVYDARQFRESDKPHISLDARLDEIQRQLELVYGGNSSVDIDYEYNERGQIIREIITGDHTIIREFTYYENEAPLVKGELKTETVYYTDGLGSLSQQVTREFSYDPATRRLLKTTVRGDS